MVYVHVSVVFHSFIIYQFFKDKAGETVLNSAIQKNKKTLVEIILEHSKIVPNPFSTSGETILEWKNKNSETPLFSAVESQNLAMVDLLITQG